MLGDLEARKGPGLVPAVRLFDHCFQAEGHPSGILHTFMTLQRTASSNYPHPLQICMPQHNFQFVLTNFRDGIGPGGHILQRSPESEVFFGHLFLPSYIYYNPHFY